MACNVLIRCSSTRKGTTGDASQCGGGARDSKCFDRSSNVPMRRDRMTLDTASSAAVPSFSSSPSMKAEGVRNGRLVALVAAEGGRLCASTGWTLLSIRVSTILLGALLREKQKYRSLLFAWVLGYVESHQQRSHTLEIFNPVGLKKTNSIDLV